ncbi:MAG TPA: lysylphosphatidylglycerol synthase transmembrane domain-containing protein [Enhygromyxa sp.]|nr:lysylphosphatidylglycerol synthase transmembrane domain-containing protein [Enhygromyxa sp.]
MSDEQTPPVDPVVVPRVKPKDVLKLVVGVVLFVLVLRYLAPNWDALRASVRFDWRYAALGLLGTTIASFVTAARWKLLAEVMGGTKLAFSSYFYALVFTRVVGQVLPTVLVDLIGRGAALQSAGSKRSLGHAAMQLVLERIFDGVLPMLMVLWAVVVSRGWLPMSPIASLALLCAGFLLLAIPLLRPSVHVALRVYLWLRLRIPWRRSAQIEARAEAELAETPAVDAKLATKVALLSLARYATVMLQCWGIAGAVGLLIPWDDMTAAASISQLASLVGITPGGLGIVEAGWAGGLAWVGITDPEQVSLCVLAQRFGFIAFFSILTIASYPFAAHEKRKRHA